MVNSKLAMLLVDVIILQFSAVSAVWKKTVRRIRNFGVIPMLCGKSWDYSFSPSSRAKRGDPFNNMQNYSILIRMNIMHH